MSPLQKILSLGCSRCLCADDGGMIRSKGFKKLPKSTLVKPWRTYLSLERTLAIIKPDAVSRNLQGEILARMNKAGFRIVAIKTLTLTSSEAAGFYAVHKGRAFFGELTEFMSSGKIFVLVLESEDAIQKWRDAMGATDPKNAAPGTIRRDFGTSIGNNCTHGYDAPETAAFEIGYFFCGLELI